VSARQANAAGNGTAAGRGNFGPIPAAFYSHPAIPDQFTHLYDSGLEIPFFDRIICLLAENRHKCLSINNLCTKSRLFQSIPIKPNQAQSCLIVPFFRTAMPPNPSLPYLTILVMIPPSDADFDMENPMPVEVVWRSDFMNRPWQGRGFR
jgi:hypothetical protein